MLFEIVWHILVSLGNLWNALKSFKTICNFWKTAILSLKLFDRIAHSTLLCCPLKGFRDVILVARRVREPVRNLFYFINLARVINPFSNQGWGRMFKSAMLLVISWDLQGGEVNPNNMVHVGWPKQSRYQGNLSHVFQVSKNKSRFEAPYCY